MKRRIYYYDTDCGGVVYYGNYMRFLEEARTEYMEERGLSVKALMDKCIWFVVKRQEIEYKAPAVYGVSWKPGPGSTRPAQSGFSSAMN